MAKYDHRKIEKKWRDVWEVSALYKTPDTSDKQKFYSLVMFPYPSGDIHMGHWYNFAPADTYSRFKRMQGYNVLNPIGFDSFGLPAENAAIKRSIHPKKWTYSNIEKMIEEIKNMGASYDWDRTVTTSDPDYYKWTQWMFLLMHKKGLAYKKKAPANWCPSCNTVLANEQVVNGKCERCGTEVIQKEIDQWLFKITDYADRLLTDLEGLDWPQKTKLMQKNWIGKSEGARIKFKVKSEKLKVEEETDLQTTNYKLQTTQIIEVYTTRPDTLFGATFMVLAPEHPFVAELLKVKSKKEKRKNHKEIEDYIAKTKKKTELERISEDEKEKTGVFTGAYAVNPVNDEKIPIWISDYVLMSYGTGAIMAVPAHDDRDGAFAKKYDLPIREVIIPKVIDKHDPPKDGAETIFRDAVQVILINPKNKKVLVLKWKKFPWTTFVTGGIEKGEDAMSAAKRELVEETGYTDFEYVKTLGGPVESHFYANHKGVNRKAHFTAMVFNLKSENKKEISKEESEIHELCWTTWDDLRKDKNIKCAEYEIWIERFFGNEKLFTDRGILIDSGEFSGLDSEEAKEKIIEWLAKNNLGKKETNYRIRDWIISRQRYWGAPIPIVICDKCGEVPVPESELPVVLPDEENVLPTGESPLKYDKKFLNTTCPKCGGKATRETDTMDTFVCSSWYYFRYIDPKNKKEFAGKNKLDYWMPIDMYIGGAEHTVLHLLYSRFFTKVLYDAGYVGVVEPFQKLRHQGTILGPDNQKMSKSKGNVVNPDELVEKYGADTTRMFLMFMGPYDQGGPWKTGGLNGIYRLLSKISDLYGEKAAEGTNPDEELERVMAKSIKKIGEDLEELHFNTAISQIMILVNALLKQKELPRSILEKFAVMLSPFAPFLAEELWERLGNKTSIHLQSWPSYDKQMIGDETITVAVQINGKVRGQVVVSKDASEEAVFEEAKSQENVSKYLEGSEIAKKIYVSGKILSIVTK